MDFGTILSGLGAAAGGGILGLFGSGIKAWASHKAEEAKRKFDLAMRTADREEMQLEHDLHMKRVEKETARDIALAEQDRLKTESEVAADVERAGIELRQASYQHDSAIDGDDWVDKIRKLMRPLLTLVLVYLLADIANKLSVITGGHIPLDTAQALFQEIVNSIIFLTTTAVTWWFGDRPLKRAN